MNKPHVPPLRSEQEFFDDPAIDRLLGVVMALATEHYVLRDRVRALEEQLSRAGHIDIPALAQAPPQEQGAVDDADAAGFVASLLRPLLGIQESAGATGGFTLGNSVRRKHKA